VTTVRPRAHRGLSLAARLAAASFGATRHAAGRNRVPRPVPLRWRRPALRVAAPGPARTQPAAPASWHPHFHLHFGVIGESRRRAGAAPMPGIGVIRGRDVVMRAHREHMLASTHRTYRVWERTRTVEGRVPLFPRRSPESPRREWAATRLMTGARALLASSRRPSPRLAAETLGSGRPRSRAVGMTLTSADASRWRAQDRLADRHPRLQQRTTPAAAAGTRDASMPAARARRPVPLVWRSAGPDPGRSSASPSRAMAASSPSASPSNPTGAPAMVPAADPARPRVPVRTADFEPGVLDRLADDVIRRVERRARIERERRGL
jgi:hypothetical protein